MRMSILVVALIGLWPLAAFADLTSPSFTIRASHVAAGASGSLSSSSYGGTGAAGQAEATGLAGTLGDLTTSAPGFVPILAGVMPSLDLDGDGTAFFLDDDDDGDGLLDVNETNTGVYVSPGDTGTDSLLFDTDGDGFGDGEEVAAGSDPTNPLSTPAAVVVPALGAAGRLVLIALVLALTLSFARRSRRSA